MTSIDTRALRTFVAVAECLNFRQAAERLHTSQPPLSRAVRLLEERLAVRLFERSTQGVEMTAAGTELLPRARQILRLLDATALHMQRHRAPQCLRLGLTTAIEPHRFEAVLQAFRSAARASPLECVSDTSPRLVRQVRAGKLDAALIALPTACEGLRLQTLGSEPMGVAVAARSPLAKRRRLSLAQLNDQPVFWFERARQPAFFDHGHAVFARHQFAPKFLREPHDHHVLLGEVSAGRGVALLPASFARLKLANVAYRPLMEGDELAIGLGLVDSDLAHPGVDLLRRVLKRAANTLG
jgi:DNA-binding transcriptional LysR family regulator